MAAAAFLRMRCVVSLQKDIAKKLGLDSAKEAEAVAGKAILDRVIDASIDHDKQFLQSKVRLCWPPRATRFTPGRFVLFLAVPCGPSLLL